MENYKTIELLLKDGKLQSNRLEKVELILLHKLYSERTEIKDLNIFVSKHSRKCGNTLISFSSSNTKSIKENLEHYLTKDAKQENEKIINSNNSVKCQLSNLNLISEEKLELIVDKNLSLLAS